MSPGGEAPSIGRVVVYVHPHGAIAPVYAALHTEPEGDTFVCDLHVLGANAGFVPAVPMDTGDVDAPQTPGTWRWPLRV